MTTPSAVSDRRGEGRDRVAETAWPCLPARSSTCSAVVKRWSPQGATRGRRLASSQAPYLVPPRLGDSPTTPSRRLGYPGTNEGEYPQSVLRQHGPGPEYAAHTRAGETFVSFERRRRSAWDHHHPHRSGTHRPGARRILAGANPSQLAPHTLGPRTRGTARHTRTPRRPPKPAGFSSRSTCRSSARLPGATATSAYPSKT